MTAVRSQYCQRSGAPPDTASVAHPALRDNRRYRRLPARRGFEGSSVIGKIKAPAELPALAVKRIGFSGFSRLHHALSLTHRNARDILVNCPGGID